MDHPGFVTMLAKLSLFALVMACLIDRSVIAAANNLYLAQNAVGLGNGQNCSNAMAVTYFNSSPVWVSTTPIATQIGPGTTVHLCGTITASAGSSGYLTFQGSGSSGNPITLLFESGAILQAPYWGANGAITSSGRSYLIIDGGSNGLLQATANGTALSNQQNGAGVLVTNCNNCEIRNLTLANMYVHTSGDTGAGKSFAISFLGGNNVLIHGNTIHDAGWCAFYAFTAQQTNIAVYNNTIYNCDGSIVVGSGNTGASVSGVSVYGNKIHDSANWDDPANNHHHDGIHIWAVHSGSSWSNVQIFNNYEYGDWGMHTTALIFIEANGGSGSGSNAIYNNVLSETNAATHFPSNGDISLQGDGWYVANNTFLNNSNAGMGGGAVQADSGNGVTVENNAMVSPSTAINFPQGASIFTGDYNCYYNVGSSIPYFYSGSAYNTFVAFRAATGLDKHSITTKPNLSSTGVPASGSALIGAGANLTSLCATFSALCVDTAGTPRPAASAWDIGAYQFISTPRTLSPPTSVTATSQ